MKEILSDIADTLYLSIEPRSKYQAQSCPFDCTTLLTATLFRSALKTFLLGVFACRPFPFLAVWGGQTEREASLFNLKFHAARFGVCVGLAALAGVSCGIGGQPVPEVGVVCADIDGGFFLVKVDFGGLFSARLPGRREPYCTIPGLQSAIFPLRRCPRRRWR